MFSPSNPEWMPGVTIKLKNTTTGPTIGGLQFYTAYNPGEEITITVDADFKPYLNVYNQGPNTQTFEVNFL